MKAINRDQKLLRKTRRKIVTMTTAIVSLLFIALDASFSAYSIIKEQNTINMVLDNTLANIPMEKNESGEENLIQISTNLELTTSEFLHSN